MNCPACGKPMEDAGRAYLDQCELTRLPARRWVCNCASSVEITLATGGPWEPYPVATAEEKRAVPCPVST